MKKSSRDVEQTQKSTGKTDNKSNGRIDSVVQKFNKVASSKSGSAREGSWNKVSRSNKLIAGMLVISDKHRRQKQKDTLIKTQTQEGKVKKSILAGRRPLVVEGSDLGNVANDGLIAKSSNQASTEKCEEEELMQEGVEGLQQISSPNIISTTTFQHDQSPLKSTFKPGHNLSFTKIEALQGSKSNDKLTEKDSVCRAKMNDGGESSEAKQLMRLKVDPKTNLTQPA